MAVSAVQGFQIAELLEKVLSFVPVVEEVEEEVPVGTIRVAIVGRANVGKSTLLNHLLHEERSIVSPIAGTTRDAIDVTFNHEGQDYLLIDTAGIRRKKAEKEVVDKFAAIRTDEAVEKADVCLLVLDSYEGFTTQEKRIASDIEEQGKSCILIFNKWDLVKNLRMEHALKDVEQELPFLSHCPKIFISALNDRNLEKIFPVVKAVYAERQRRITTGMLNKFIEGCLHKYHPPLIIGKRLRIYYMTQVETNPPKFVLFVNNPTLMTESYKKYLINHFREVYGFSGCPLVLELRGKAPPAPAEPRLL
jgi:GTP-binding protein